MEAQRGERRRVTLPTAAVRTLFRRLGIGVAIGGLIVSAAAFGSVSWSSLDTASSAVLIPQSICLAVTCVGQALAVAGLGPRWTVGRMVGATACAATAVLTGVALVAGSGAPTYTTSGLWFLAACGAGLAGVAVLGDASWRRGMALERAQRDSLH